MAHRLLVLTSAAVLALSASKGGWSQEPAETREAAMPFETPTINADSGDTQEFLSDRQHLSSTTFFPSMQLDQPQQFEIEFEFTAAQLEIKFAFDPANGFSLEDSHEEDLVTIEHIVFQLN